MMEEDQHDVCPLCLSKKSKYTCPRCNVRYCSVDCYKGEKHMQCSEAFYKDCFMEGLKDKTASTEEKTKMVEMLQRVEQEQSSGDLDDDDEPDLHERLEGLDLGDAEAVWNQLTDEEKQDFEKMAQDGRLGGLVDVWTPWWTVKEDKLIQDVEEKKNSSTEDIPQIPQHIPDISSLLKNSKPSADVKHTVVCAIYAYCFVCRLHNGSHLESPLESAEEVLLVSDLANKDVVHFSAREATQSCLQKTQDPVFREQTTLQYRISIIQDVIAIIHGPSLDRPLEYLTMALSELVQILTEARKQLSAEQKKGKQLKGGNSFKKKLFAAEKKAEFLLSWTQRLGMSLHSVVTELQLEHSAAMSEVMEFDDSKAQLEEVWGGKQKPKQHRLVEEIS